MKTRTIVAASVTTVIGIALAVGTVYAVVNTDKLHVFAGTNTGMYLKSKVFGQNDINAIEMGPARDYLSFGAGQAEINFSEHGFFIQPDDDVIWFLENNVADHTDDLLGITADDFYMLVRKLDFTLDADDNIAMTSLTGGSSIEIQDTGDVVIQLGS